MNNFCSNVNQMGGGGDFYLKIATGSWNIQLIKNKQHEPKFHRDEFLVPLCHMTWSFSNVILFVKVVIVVGSGGGVVEFTGG